MVAAALMPLPMTSPTTRAVLSSWRGMASYQSPPISLVAPAGGVGHQYRLAGAHALGDQAVAVVRGEFPWRVGCADRLGGVGRADGEGAEEGRALAWRGPAVKGAVEYVHGCHIGQDRYDDVGELARCRFQIEGGTHAGGSP